MTGFSNLKKVAGGNCKVAGALSHRDDSSLQMNQRNNEI